MRFSLVVLVPLTALIVPAFPAASAGSRKHNHPRKGLLWFLCSLEAFLDLPVCVPLNGSTTSATGSLLSSMDMTGKAGSLAGVTHSPVGFLFIHLTSQTARTIAWPMINPTLAKSYTLEGSVEQFICMLFEEIVDSTTWGYDCEDEWVYYSSTYPNVYYSATR
ncbi:hypothetical protein EDD85DRAFT_796526 [Armillaria nabsnona]|nr:hypothetical protein EDD85DRAFT_796526 [Armillaria nabsnona]